MSAAVPGLPAATPSAPRLPDLSVRYFCKDCRDPVPNIIEDFSSGDVVCGTCGLVLGPRIIDTRSEWRTFANDDGGGDDPSRVGGPSDPLLGMNRLESTYISARDSGTGRASQLNRAQYKVKEIKEEKALLDAFKQISVMGERIGLTKVVIDAAKQFYKKVEDEKLLKAKLKSQEPVMAACIYIACRQKHVTRTFKEICALTKVPKKEIGRVYKALKPLLENQTAEIINIEGYAARFGAQLNMSLAEIRQTQELVSAEKELLLLEGKSPTSIVAACLYAISWLKKAQEEEKLNAQARADGAKYGYITVPPTATAAQISKVCGCTEGTLKNAYKTIWEHRKELMARTKSMKDLNPDLLPTP
ncbi:hypothetical protein DFJ74DRAFT_651391 [Hyaloraphidium curvatum]|nr:hypothetical protein DFJ74DRAFT_651391 [Hyaloraphidium curvatum]